MQPIHQVLVSTIWQMPKTDSKKLNETNNNIYNRPAATASIAWLYIFYSKKANWRDYMENFTPSSSAEVPLNIASFPFCSSTLKARISIVRSIPWSSEVFTDEERDSSHQVDKLSSKIIQKLIQNHESTKVFFKCACPNESSNILRPTPNQKQLDSSTQFCLQEAKQHFTEMTTMSIQNDHVKLRSS